MHLRTVGGVTFILLLMNLNIGIATDWFNGARDLYGPYPRIPDKELLEKEIEFAKENRKYLKAPKTIFIYK